ncbi:MAG: universal stress protein [Thiobacillus sp.]|nr:universal stress protein [Thiobacillus sp.]
MYRRVLAPIDLSAHSSAVAETARRVAPKAHLTLAHAFEVPFEGKLQFAGVSEDDILHYRQEERQTALDTLRTLAEMQDRPNIRLEHGRPEAVIPILLRETVTDLVVGKHE